MKVNKKKLIVAAGSIFITLAVPFLSYDIARRTLADKAAVRVEALSLVKAHESRLNNHLQKVLLRLENKMQNIESSIGNELDKYVKGRGKTKRFLLKITFFKKTLAKRINVAYQMMHRGASSLVVIADNLKKGEEVSGSELSKALDKYTVGFKKTFRSMARARDAAARAITLENGGNASNIESLFDNLHSLVGEQLEVVRLMQNILRDMGGDSISPNDMNALLGGTSGNLLSSLVPGAIVESVRHGGNSNSNAKAFGKRIESLVNAQVRAQLERDGFKPGPSLMP